MKKIKIQAFLNLTIAKEKLVQWNLIINGKQLDSEECKRTFKIKKTQLKIKTRNLISRLMLLNLKDQAYKKRMQTHKK